MIIKKTPPPKYNHIRYKEIQNTAYKRYGIVVYSFQPYNNYDLFTLVCFWNDRQYYLRFPMRVHKTYQHAYREYAKWLWILK